MRKTVGLPVPATAGAYQTQQGIGAGRHAEVAEQAGAGLAAGGDRDPALCRSKTSRSAGVWRDQAGQRLGEGPPSATGVAAEEAPYPQHKPDLAAD